jgi:hypothetical protein
LLNAIVSATAGRLDPHRISKYEPFKELASLPTFRTAGVAAGL